jgi:hypothetical protein
MANRKAIGVVAGVTTVAAWLWLFLFFNPRAPGIDRRPHEALGEVLAAEALKRLEPGARLVVIGRDPTVFPVRASSAQLECFTRAIEKARRSITSLHTFKMDPRRQVGVPPVDFFDLLRQAKENDVIVSFLGPPVLGDAQLVKIGAKRPAVLAVCSGAMPSQMDLKRLFDQKLLTAAVISREDAPAHLHPGSKQNAFEQMFIVITAANLAELPPPSRSLN